MKPFASENGRHYQRRRLVLQPHRNRPLRAQGSHQGRPRGEEIQARWQHAYHAARNLYLSASKNPLRKFKEIVITFQLEHTLSKQRIFELYSNPVEWGRGIYGAEAASRHHFEKSASDLNDVKAATLAALLPNPRNPAEKSLLYYRRNLVLARMARIAYIDEAAYIRGKEAPLFSKVNG